MASAHDHESVYEHVFNLVEHLKADAYAVLRDIVNATDAFQREIIAAAQDNHVAQHIWTRISARGSATPTPSSPIPTSSSGIVKG